MQLSSLDRNEKIVYGRKDEWMDRRIDGQTNGQTDKWTDEWTDKWMDGPMDGRTDLWANGVTMSLLELLTAANNIWEEASP